MPKFQYHIDCVICKGLGSLPVQPKKGLIMLGLGTPIISAIKAKLEENAKTIQISQ